MWGVGCRIMTYSFSFYLTLWRQDTDHTNISCHMFYSIDLSFFYVSCISIHQLCQFKQLLEVLDRTHLHKKQDSMIKTDKENQALETLNKRHNNKSLMSFQTTNLEMESVE